MSETAGGKGRCDNPECKQLLDSPSLVNFLVVNDLNFDTGKVITAHYCRVNGCADKMKAAVDNA